jgi:hypothetical protein
MVRLPLTEQYLVSVEIDCLFPGFRLVFCWSTLTRTRRTSSEARFPEIPPIKGEQVITLGFGQTSATPRKRRPQSHVNLFFKMCEHVLEFMQEQTGQNFEVFFARDGGSISLYLVTKAEAYDFELSRKLAEFAAPYIERGLLDSASLLPASSSAELEAFFDPTMALRVEFQHA